MACKSYGLFGNKSSSVYPKAQLPFVKPSFVVLKEFLVDLLFVRALRILLPELFYILITKV